MSDILSTSVSGLLAFQQALEVTSNNIANSATAGYSVERVNFTPQPGLTTAAGYIGGGVAINGVTRSYSELLALQVRSSQASFSSINAIAAQAAQIDKLLSASSTGLPDTLQSFVNALQTLSSTPTSTAARQALLSQAQALAQQLSGYDSQITQYGKNLESQIGADVNQINSLASNLATLNNRIATAVAGNQQPNQLMDERDQLLDQLSQYVSVNTATEPNGMMDVYIGSGQALVSGGTAQALVTLPNQYNASQSQIGIATGGGTADVTAEINGGELGGLLSARQQVLAPAQNALGQISVGIAQLLNQQQQAGVDQNGAQGQPMFTVGGVQTLASSNNAGNASITASRTSLSALTADDYVLQYRGGSWQMQDVSTGQSVALSGTGTAADPLQGPGFSMVVSGTPVDGDSYMIRPTAGATAGLSMTLTDPAQVAAASLAQTAAGGSNSGSGTISAASVTDSTAWIPDSYALTFTSPTQYQITDSAGTVIASGAYSAGQAIDFRGVQVSVSGAPAAGDTFSISSTPPLSGDNSNLIAMINTLAAPTLSGGTTSLGGAANNLIAQIGVVTQQAQANAAAEQAVNQDAVSARSNVSGVNLDAEAAKMLQFQQAYQAMAQMIQASSQMFTSLINAIAQS
jgi:flagellar hook-associated protein 1